MSRLGGIKRYRQEARAYLGLMALLVITLNLPSSLTARLRGTVVATTTPLAWVAHMAETGIIRPVQGMFPGKRRQRLQQAEQIQQLTAENEALSSQVSQLLQLVQEQVLNDPSTPLFPRPPMPAHVVLRPPEQWLQTVWINVGTNDNDNLGYQAVGVDSPVVAGSRLIGIIDQVGRRQSRVRLITDPALVAAVRIARGQPQNLELMDHLDHLLDALHFRDDIGSSEQRENLSHDLEALRHTIEADTQSWRLAKGELQGGGSRHKDGRPLLRGRGFNCDWADEHGPARDLRTGEPLDKQGAAMALIAPGDLLITSGLDGLFPPNLHVGTVTRVHPLKEGASAYELEAVPCCSDLDQLHLVSVLPPTLVSH